MKRHPSKVSRVNSPKLSLEALELRIVLDADPVLTVLGDQNADEGALLSIENIGTFTDVVEGNATGGSSIGLDPNAFASLGAFDTNNYAAITNITIDTGINGDALSIPTLTVEYGAAQTATFSGVTTTADTGAGAYDIAVFTFDSFTLADFNPGAASAVNPAEIFATGGRPLAILSQGDTAIAGTIDASAQEDTDPTSSIFNNERFAGPGGGDGGEGGNAPVLLSGDPAAGAPADSVGNPRGAGGGTGGGHGGNGGLAEGFQGTIGGVAGLAFSDITVGIQGGSGGGTAGGGFFGGSGYLAGGGGGGGGVELGATGTITITGEVLADGGDGQEGIAIQNVGSGGGGAGGGILVHATNINQNGTLSAQGGSALGAPRDGGGGGGGAIALVYSDTGTFDNTGGTQNVDGGMGGTGQGQDGDMGVIDIIAETPPATPIIETFDYIIDWGDGSAVDAGAATIDTAGVNIGDIVAGSFDGSHTYADDGTYTVTVTITGSEGGSDTQTFLANIANVAPTLTLAGAASSDEGAGYTVTLSSSDPGDDTITQWDIDWGDGTVETLVGDPTSASHTYADGDNNYTISATATDEDGTFAAANTLAVDVANVAPTLAISGAATSDEGASYTLDLTSSDPGDDTISQWDIDWGDGTIETVTGDPASATHTYADGDNSYTISATATDEDGTFAAGNTVAVDVANLAPVIVSLSTDSGSLGGAKAGETVNLSASFTDAGVLDTHTATIDWGDGTTSVGTVDQGTGTVTADHVYAEGGYYEVTLTLTDNDTGQDIAMTATVIAGVGVQDGVLNLVGTNGNDKFKVFKVGNTDDLRVRYRLDGGSDTWATVNGPVDEINMQLGDGDDVGFVSRRVHTDAVIDAGAGDDLLAGGSGNDILLAGAGYDTLFGGSGRDLMIGGTESDLIFGDGGSDILISGTTAFDNDRASLDAVMAEWTSSRSYSERVDNITGDLDLSMDGLNGEIFLIADETVFDDEAIDWLIGGRGKDLYFAGDDDYSFARFNEVIEDLEAEGTV